jgi:hypothetical protein
LNIRASRHVGVRFRQLLERLDILSSRSIPSRLSRNPSWSFKRAVYDFRRVRHMRGDTSAPIPTARLLFAYTNNTAVYTDGLVVQGSTGSAFVYEDEDILHTSPTVQMACKVYMAEPYAINRDLFSFGSSLGDLTSFAGSSKAMQSLQMHASDQSFRRFFSKCSIFTRRGSLADFVGYLVTQSTMELGCLYCP